MPHGCLSTVLFVCVDLPQYYVYLIFDQRPLTFQSQQYKAENTSYFAGDFVKNILDLFLCENVY